MHPIFKIVYKFLNFIPNSEMKWPFCIIFFRFLLFLSIYKKEPLIIAVLCAVHRGIRLASSSFLL